jgi:hypothetical protein
MAVAVESSALGLELRRISAGPGSPYYKIEVFITAGGRNLTPLQVTRGDVGRDYKGSYMDDHSFTLTYGSGTAIFDIAPFQDDLTMTIKKHIVGGFSDGKEVGAIEARTYTAYLTDDLPRGPEISAAPQFKDRETANRLKTLQLTFVLEEVAVTQLRKMSIGGIIRATPPYMVMKTLLSNALASIQVPLESKINGFQMEEPSNKAPRDHIELSDGTMLVDLPDILQNDKGGIYSSGLGFYIQGPFVYAWPVYDTKRLATAKRVLQIFLAPSQATSGVDKTWTDDGRCISVWSAGAPKLMNDSFDVLNTEGNATRFADASKLIGGMGKAEGNKFTMNRGTNNSEFATTVVGNGSMYAKRSGVGFTANPYVEASKMARRQGQFMLIPWERSNPDKLVPSMAVEVYYDDGGEIKIMSGTLTGNDSQYVLQGKGPTERVFACKTMIEVFLDRDDPEFKEFLSKGGNVSGTPQIDPL